MGRLVVTAFITLDGVSRAPGGPREDREGGFEQGGRSVPYGDGDFGAFLAEVLDRSGAFLLGRRTYDISAAYRPRVTDPADPVASRLTSLSKYVVSRTLAVPSRAGTTVLGGDLAEEVTAVGERTEGELQVHGSGALVRSLLALDPVDPCTRWCSRSCPAPGAASSPRVPSPPRSATPVRAPRARLSPSSPTRSRAVRDTDRTSLRRTHRPRSSAPVRRSFRPRGGPGRAVPARGGGRCGAPVRPPPPRCRGRHGRWRASGRSTRARTSLAAPGGPGPVRQHRAHAPP